MDVTSETGATDVLNLELYFARTAGEPIDIGDPSRLVAENGAAITWNSP